MDKDISGTSTKKRDSFLRMIADAMAGVAKDEVRKLSERLNRPSKTAKYWATTSCGGMTKRTVC